MHPTLNAQILHHILTTVGPLNSTGTWLALPVKKRRIPILHSVLRSRTKLIVPPELKAPYVKRDRPAPTLRATHWIALTILNRVVELVEYEVKVYQARLISTSRTRKRACTVGTYKLQMKKFVPYVPNITPVSLS